MFQEFSRRGIAIVASLSLLTVVGCNSGSNDSIPDEMNQNSTSANTEKPIDSAMPLANVDSSTIVKKNVAAVDSKVETHIVTIDNMKFNPETLTIKKGDKVTFTNNDIVAHNATELKNAWASPLLANGQSWTFSPEMSSDYYCTVHVVMKGKIIVK